MRPNAGSDRNGWKAARAADSSKGITSGSCFARVRIMGMSAASSPRVASRNCSAGILFPALLEQFGDEAGPAGLMTGADPSAIVAVEIFIEQKQIAPVRI